MMAASLHLEKIRLINSKNIFGLINFFRKKSLTMQDGYIKMKLVIKRSAWTICQHMMRCAARTSVVYWELYIFGSIVFSSLF